MLWRNDQSPARKLAEFSVRILRRNAIPEPGSAAAWSGPGLASTESFRVSPFQAAREGLGRRHPDEKPLGQDAVPRRRAARIAPERVRQRRGEQGRLPPCELPGGFAEIAPRCGLRSEHALAP